MPRNRYAIRHGEFSNDRLPTDGGRESPIDYRRVVRAEFKSMVRENNSPAASSLPRNLGRGPRPESWLLATERIRDANLICGLPVCYGGRREQITQAAEKSHRGHNDDACLARSISVLLERVHVGFDLSGEFLCNERLVISQLRRLQLRHLFRKRPVGSFTPRSSGEPGRVQSRDSAHSTPKSVYT